MKTKELSELDYATLEKWWHQPKDMDQFVGVSMANIFACFVETHKRLARIEKKLDSKGD